MLILLLNGIMNNSLAEDTVNTEIHFLLPNAQLV